MRISAKPARQYPWYLRPFFWNQRRKYGAVLDSALLWARSPKLFLGVALLYVAIERRSSPLSPTLRSLLTTGPRVVRVVGAIVLATVGLLAGPAPAASNEDYKVIDGLAVYLGILPAGMIRDHGETHPESTMHGGPGSNGDYHVVVAIFETASGERVEDAEVSATVEGLGHIRQEGLTLEPMAIAGTVTYGGFFTPPDDGRYVIAIEIRRPGQAEPVRIDFIYRHMTP